MFEQTVYPITSAFGRLESHCMACAQQTPLCHDLEGFIKTFAAVLGEMNADIREELRILFMKIDANSDGEVDWEEFTTFLIATDQVRGLRGLAPTSDFEKMSPKGECEHRFESLNFEVFGKCPNLI